MEVYLIAQTPDATRVVATAARNCYSNSGPAKIWKDMNSDEAKKIIEKVLALGHESVLEHAVFTFSVDDVSRTLLAQITRHRIASFSVKSQRYVSELQFDSCTPPSIKDNPEAVEVFEEAMANAAESYQDLVALGIPKEDARFVLPGACTTHIVFTMNARELLHFFKLRCCNRAQWEIRNLAEEMLKLCRREAPFLFTKAGPSCIRGKCSEGEMGCGKAEEVRSKFNDLK